ncbi:VOC family protein [Natrinema pallidum]|uniref:Glyoxalase/bleomycin resistance protein/dioxygenase n=1 Tax=Natrinema pallidum DSM 3751 TaxID=1227495 RepID=L9YHC5_9EURY|nr:VOC family protein [Natrinema pallidum]ELY73091.1 Glyoxalase/bleomycin resistance protein/dioxygenase [Natrinema pallidum DSM 3751]
MSRSPSLPDDTHLGRTALSVADRAAMIEFYRDVVGLRVQHRDGTGTTLGVAETPLLVLYEDPDAEPRGERETGLYHNAFRVPSREALGSAVARLRDRWTLAGATDHGVSEALYCTDPEGNGVEIYRDRPRDAWPRTEDGSIRATSDPLDIAALAAAADDATESVGSQLIPDGTTLGHVHLEVSSLEDARAFYAATLGFDVSMAFGQGACFLAAGGYHHHVGLNTWNRRSTPNGGLGLEWVELLVPDAGAVDTVRARLVGNGVSVTAVDDGIEFTDPDGIAIRLRAAD